jgi:hypothetical protein
MPNAAGSGVIIGDPSRIVRHPKHQGVRLTNLPICRL